MFEFAISALILSTTAWIVVLLVTHIIEWYWDNF